MPLLSCEDVTPDTLLGVWKIEETAADFCTSSPFLQTIFQSELTACHSCSRQVERLAVYALVEQLTQQPLRIMHNAAGKPFIAGSHISISHTKGYAAVILSKTHEVAIDIEYISPRINRIADRFIRPDEQALTTEERLLIWCAKETLYKYCSAEDLQFFDMRVAHHDEKPGIRSIENLRQGRSFTIVHRANKDFVLTYIA